MQPRVPSGLFPSGPVRPTFREPHPIRPFPVVAGAGLTMAWQILLTTFATTLDGVFWRSVAGTLVAAGVAVLLLLRGDRGAAVGVAMAATLGASVAAIIVTVRWMIVGWPLW